MTRVTPGCLGAWKSAIVFYVYDIDPIDMRIYALLIYSNITRYHFIGSLLESSETLYE